jgi:hypothetical protein
LLMTLIRVFITQGVTVSQLLDRQHQQYMTSAHTDTNHYYAWFQGQCKCPDVLLGTSVKYLHFQDLTFRDVKLYTPKLNSPKDLIRESGATPNRCTYTVPIFDQFDEKELNNFMPE